MKNFKNIVRMFAATALLTGTLMSADAQDREHRAIWMSPYLGSNWPTSAITEGTAASHKNILCKALDKLKRQNINVLYYHVRSCCDANYKSSYEPWSDAVSSARGVAPAFDPFEYIIEQAHLRGIEVYGWLNPYRYHHDKGGSWGSADFNYEVSHPEWLINGNSSNRVLNPALEEVKQRIVDVCREVVVNYDVDGIIFDDYFYPQGGTTESSSAPDYAQYTASGTTMKIGDWRRANVNEMLSRVYQMIKKEKPYVCFGVSPAGSANPPNVTSYGLPVGPVSDWQYNTIYSDPVAWLNGGFIDFISPQVYWTTSGTFIPLTQWWANTAQHFGRHLYESVNLDGDGLTDLTEDGAEELIQQLLNIREYCDENASGIAYFQYSPFMNYTEKYNSNVNHTFGEIMASTVCQTKALTPLRSWNNSLNPKMTSNVTLNDRTLTWDVVEGMRYTVYAVPENLSDAEFYCQKEYLEAICYTNSFTVPNDTIITAEKDRNGNVLYADTLINNKTKGYRWAVAVYDRFGNEYSPLFAGATASTMSAPVTLTSPIGGANAPGLFDLQWTGEGSRFVVEIAADAAFTNIIGTAECGEKRVSNSKFPTMSEGVTYYWRVRSSKPNAQEVTSKVESFVYSRMAMTYPTAGATGVKINDTFKWTPAGEGVEYLLEISKAGTFNDSTYVTKVSAASLAIPDTKLSTGTKYSARITAMKDGAKSTSETITFTTEDVTYTAAPVIAYPNVNGITLYSNEAIKVNPWTGLTNVGLEISTTSAFGRNSKTETLGVGKFESAQLGTKSLKDGTTYYVRARGKFALTTKSSLQNTPYSEVMSFVYNAGTGVEDVTVNDGIYVNSANILVVGGQLANAEVYTIAGQLVESVMVESEHDLNHLATGAYIIRVATAQGTKTIKFVK